MAIFGNLFGGSNQQPDTTALQQIPVGQYADPFADMNFLEKLGLGLQGTQAVNQRRMQEYKMQDLAQRRQQEALERQQEQERRTALQELGQRYSAGEIGRDAAALQYAGITGDFSSAFGPGAAAPSAVREYEYYSKLPKEQQTDYLSVKRANQLLDLGATQTLLDPQGQIVREFEKTLAPEQRPELKAEQAGASEQAKLQQQLAIQPKIEAEKLRAKSIEEGFQQLPIAQRTLAGMESAYENINEIAAGLQKADPWAFGLKGAISSAVPGSPAHDVASDLETILSAAGLDKLVELKKLGGTLGAVSEKELSLLESSVRNLRQSQSAEQFQRNLAAFQKQRTQSMEALRRAYEQDYKRYGGERDPNLPTPSQKQPDSQTETPIDELEKILNIKLVR